MKSSTLTTVACFIGLFLLLSLAGGSVAPVTAQGAQPPPLPRRESLDDIEHIQIQQDAGGPDDFGYIYNTDVSMTWIDATGGPSTGQDDNCGDFAAVPIGFSFKFYEKAYSTVYVGYNGVLTFDPNYSGCFTHGQTPLPSTPNNVIAPYWNHFRDDADKIHYLYGGITPNRFLVIEWHQMIDYSDSNCTYTFETILHENGDVVFQYQTMTYGSHCGTAGAGIEDSTGLIGLAPFGAYAHPSSGDVVRFYRPSPAARVMLTPAMAGKFGAPGAAAQFSLVVRNTGELGSDTYDLFASSSWTTTLYQSDGSTLLTDTDGDSAVDTGSIASGSSKAIVVQVAVPGNATAGQSSSGQLTVRSSVDPSKSKVALFQAAVPAPFAQSYTRDWYPQVGLYRPSEQTTHQTTGASSYNPAVATTPDGNIVQVWYQGRENSHNAYVEELYYAVLDSHGSVVRSATQFTDHSEETLDTYDESPAVAVSPDGDVAVVWRRDRWNEANTDDNVNIHYKVIDSDGDVVVPSTSLTDNTLWGRTNVPQFYNPTIAATLDSRFVMAWERYVYDGSNWFNTIWYVVRDASGGEVKAPTRFSTDARSYNPGLALLSGSNVLLTLSASNDQISYGRLDSAGNILTGLTALASANGYLPDAVQLPNGNIVMAWSNYFSSKPFIQYAVLDSGLSVVKGVTNLSNLSPVGDYYVSVTRANNQAVLTWGDACCGYQPNLYYALLDGNGNLATPPMIFASDTSSYRIRLPNNGQGNTTLPADVTPPTNPVTMTSSHPVNNWSNDNTVQVGWSGAADTESGLDGYSVVWDDDDATVPDTTKDIEETVVTMTSPALTDGDRYFHIRAVDNAGNWAIGATHIGPFRIDTIPPQSCAASPEFSVGAFMVTWSGADAASGIVNYNVWVRDGASGTWTTWQSATIATGASYSGAAGHTYYFRSEARDAAGNVETDLPAAGDTHTTVAAAQATGQVTNNRHQPIYNAEVVALPSALNTARSSGNGEYVLYFNNTGAYTLTASHTGFGTLSPRYNLNVNSSLTVMDWVLPPSSEAVSNGEWETGNLSGWHVGAGVTPTVGMSAAHTGRYGLELNAGGGTLGFWPYVTQSLSVQAGWVQPTLSWLYRAVQGSADDKLLIRIVSASQAITPSAALTPGEWTHAWYDLSAFSGQTVTLQLGFKNQSGSQQIYIDEISLGPSRTGVFPIYLPVVMRNA